MSNASYGLPKVTFYIPCGIVGKCETIILYIYMYIRE